MFRFISLIILCVVFPFMASAQSSTPILVDQFGYLPELQKRAVIKNPKKGYDSEKSFRPSKRYSVIDRRSGRVVYEGRPVAWKSGQTDSVSGDQIWWFDFSSVTKPGSYIVRDMDNAIDSYPFDISPNVYKPVLVSAVKTLYLQRAGFEKKRPYAPEGYTDKASHLKQGQDTEARLFTKKDDASTTKDLRGGWYDAGDYNQYTSWTANYIRSLLSAYLENPRAWTDDFGIPESGNGIPDILDEVKWGLDWLERMQEPSGAMLSILGRADASPPSQSKGPSYYGPVNTSATISSAAAFAIAGKVYSANPKLASHGKRYGERALKAWNWASTNPNVRFANNDEGFNSIGLGAGQQEVDAERLRLKTLMASIHLYALTGDKRFGKEAEKLYSRTQPMTPATFNGFESDVVFDLLYLAQQKGISSSFSRKIKRDYDRKILNAYNAWPTIQSQESAYGAFVDGYWWGSNSVKARRGSIYTQSVLRQIGSEPSIDYLNAGLGFVNYLHGVNPNGKAYLSNMSGYGAENSVTSFYHLWFRDGSKLYDDVKTSKYGPAPGFLVGGPNEGYERAECCASGTCGGYGDKMCRAPILTPPFGQPAAKSYKDFNTGWPINSWSVTENSNGYQTSYIRLLSKYVR